MSADPNNSHSLQISHAPFFDIQERSNWVSVLFFFKALARVRVPSAPILLSNQLYWSNGRNYLFKQAKYYFRHTFEIQLSESRILLQGLDNSKGTNRANAITYIIHMLAGCNQLHVVRLHTNFRLTRDIQMDKSRVILQGLGQIFGTSNANIIIYINNYIRTSQLEN